MEPPALSQKSLETYSRCLRQLREAFKGESYEFLLDHKAVIAWIEGLNKAMNTKKLFYISLVATLKRLNKAEFSEALKAYKTKQDSYNKVVSEKYELQEKSEYEQENWVDWPAILKAREDARVVVSDIQTYCDYIILCLYTYHPPVRLDYSPMAVVYEETPQQKGNRLLVLPSGLTFVIEEFKTSKRYGTQRIPVVKELATILRGWLEINQSGWLLIDSTGGPMSETLLSKRISDVLKRHTGKAASLNIIRHSFATWMRRKEKPLKHLANVAAAMLHSPAMNQLYRKVG